MTAANKAVKNRIVRGRMEENTEGTFDIFGRESRHAADER